MNTESKKIEQKEILIPDGLNTLKASISLAENPKSWIIFAHGSGSSHKSPRNRFVAQKLNENGVSTLLFDLLSEEEEIYYRNRFHNDLMAERLLTATRWLLDSDFYKDSGNLEIGYFGGSTGAAVILEAAAKAQEDLPISLLISRGGRPDLVEEETLKGLNIPVVFIVGEHDPQVIRLNQAAMDHLQDARVEIIPGATHLFTEEGKMDDVAEITVKEVCRPKSGLQSFTKKLQEIFVE